MTDYTTRMQGRLPARLAEAPAFSPVTGGLQAALAAQLQALGDASVALSAALRDVDRRFAHDQLLMRSLTALPVGATIYDWETGATATVSAVRAFDAETPATWAYTLTDLVGEIYLDDQIFTPAAPPSGVYKGAALADLFPADNAYLAGLARIVGERRGPTDPDDLARARVLARAAANASWGRVGDLLASAEHLFPGGVFLDDGGEGTSAASPWGTGRVGNGTVLLEPLTSTGLAELYYQALLRIVRTAKPAGVRLDVGALRARGASAFAFATTTLTGLTWAGSVDLLAGNRVSQASGAAGVVLADARSPDATSVSIAPDGPTPWAPGDVWLPDTGGDLAVTAATVTYSGAAFGDGSVFYSVETT